MVPAEHGLARDVRELGVAVGRIAVLKSHRGRVMSAADPALRDGFHGYEPDLDLRWTNGDARLPAALFDGFDGRVDVALYLRGGTRYLDWMPARVA